jgi:UDP-glucose 4-epimerase
MKLTGLNIMVTGGAGFIGSHLVDKLIQMGNQVNVYDNFDEYYEGKEYNIQNHLGNSNFNLIKADILDYDTLCKSMNNVDIVFHFAAQAGVRYSFEHPIKTNTINTTGTLNVLNAAKTNQLKKIIFASSSSVYGVPQYLPIDEKHPTNPISIYGVSKLAAERYCRILELPTVMLRFHTVYGPRLRPDLAIHNWIHRLFQNKPPVIYGDGKQTRDFTYIDDLIDGILKSAETEGIEGEVFNLGSGSNVSINNVVELLLKLTHKVDLKPIHTEPKLGDVPDTHANVSKARNILGYDPKMNFESGIRHLITWYKSYSKAA